MVYKLKNILMNKNNFKKEKRLIVSIANVSGYKEEIIYKFVKKHQWLKHLRNTSTLQQDH